MRKLLFFSGNRKKDNEMLKQLINDPDVESKIGGWSFPSSDEKQLQWYDTIINDRSLMHVWFSVDIDGQCIGMAALHNIDYKNSNANIDIKLIKEFCGKGIGGRIICILEKYAFEELNLHELLSEILEDNTASRKSFERAGFSLDGIVRNKIYKGGKYHGQCLYSLLKEEYKQRKQV